MCVQVAAVQRTSCLSKLAALASAPSSLEAPDAPVGAPAAGMFREIRLTIRGKHHKSGRIWWRFTCHTSAAQVVVLPSVFCGVPQGQTFDRGF